MQKLYVGTLRRDYTRKFDHALTGARSAKGNWRVVEVVQI